MRSSEDKYYEKPKKKFKIANTLEVFTQSKGNANIVSIVDHGIDTYEKTSDKFPDCQYIVYDE